MITPEQFFKMTPEEQTKVKTLDLHIGSLYQLAIAMDDAVKFNDGYKLNSAINLLNELNTQIQAILAKAKSMALDPDFNGPEPKAKA